MSIDVATRSSSSPSVRELLDQAKAVEHEDATASRTLVQQARVLARSQGDEPGEAEAFYRLASLAYYGGLADEAFGVAVDAPQSRDGEDVLTLRDPNGMIIDLVASDGDGRSGWCTRDRWAVATSSRAMPAVRSGSAGQRGATSVRCRGRSRRVRSCRRSAGRW